MNNSNKYLVYVRFIVIIEVHLSLNRGLPSSHETTAWARGPSRNHPLVARFMGHRRLNDEEARSAAPGPIWRASARKSASRSLETDESSSVFAPFTGGDCFGGEFPPLYIDFDLLVNFWEPSLDFLADIPKESLSLPWTGRSCHLPPRRKKMPWTGRVAREMEMCGGGMGMGSSATDGPVSCDCDHHQAIISN